MELMYIIAWILIMLILSVPVLYICACISIFTIVGIASLFSKLFKPVQCDKVFFGDFFCVEEG